MAVADMKKHQIHSIERRTMLPMQIRVGGAGFRDHTRAGRKLDGGLMILWGDEGREPEWPMRPRRKPSRLEKAASKEVPGRPLFGNWFHVTTLESL